MMSYHFQILSDLNIFPAFYIVTNVFKISVRKVYLKDKFTEILHDNLNKKKVK